MKPLALLRWLSRRVAPRDRATAAWRDVGGVRDDLSGSRGPLAIPFRQQSGWDDASMDLSSEDDNLSRQTVPSNNLQHAARGVDQ